MILKPAAGLGTIALLTVTAAAQGQSGLRATVSTGIFPSLTQVAPVDPIGIGLEFTPEWRWRSGVGIGVGFRYVVYSGVPNHGSLFLEAKWVAASGTIRPILGLRAGLFGGGDDGVDEGYFGVQAGPMVGFEKPISPNTSLVILGTALGTAGVYRSAQLMPGLQFGVAVR